MNILSLFDGISCGQLALKRANIPIDNYYASEVDTYAIKVTQNNFPNTIQLGDIRNLSYNNGLLKSDNGEYYVDKIDLLIGGSPCQSFTFAGKREGMVTTEDVEIKSLEEYLFYKNCGYSFKGQSYLFWEFMRLLTEISPKWFLLENVKMAKSQENIITAAIGGGVHYI